MFFEKKNRFEVRVSLLSGLVENLRREVLDFANKENLLSGISIENMHIFALCIMRDLLTSHCGNNNETNDLVKAVELKVAYEIYSIQNSQQQPIFSDKAVVFAEDFRTIQAEQYSFYIKSTKISWVFSILNNQRKNEEFSIFVSDYTPNFFIDEYQPKLSSKQTQDAYRIISSWLLETQNKILSNFERSKVGYV
jgi:hypothetical protein